MNTHDWRPEMQHLLEVFQRESTLSLRKIKQCFVASDRPFDDQFRQSFLKMSIIRLNTGFNTILFEGCFDKAAVQIPPKSDGATDADSIGDFPTTPKIENITDSDGKNNAQEQNMNVTDGPTELQGRSKPLLQPNDDDANFEVGPSRPDLSNQNGIECDVKREIKVETGTEAEMGMEMVDLPVVEFDPVKEKERFSKGNCASDTESVGGEQCQAGPSSSVQKREKRGASNIFKCKYCAYTSKYKNDVKRHQQTHDASAAKLFKCEYCDYSSRLKYNLNAHQRAHVHANEKSIGVARVPKDGLYKCTHCTQNFISLGALSSHWSKSHRNDQRLFHCVHCMRRFTQETEKDNHEVRCRGRRYECYLCKIYGSRKLVDMQRHMRTHSGAMPFQCAICNRFFHRKDTLEYHLNSIHRHA